MKFNGIVIVSTLIVMSFFLGILFGVSASASDAPVGQVYFGNPRTYRKPAEIQAVIILKVIPEYNQLINDGLDPSEPRYWLLMDKAYKKFIAAVVSVSKRYNYDLVGEKGFLVDQKNIEDITLVVLLEIQGKP